MDIKVEFNPDLALRDISEFEKGNCKQEECVPVQLKADGVHDFLKSSQRLFWLNDSEFWDKGQIPLCKMSGNEKLSRPLASIKILEVTHFLDGGEVWTKGKYKVVDVFDENDPRVNFEAVKRI